MSNNNTYRCVYYWIAIAILSMIIFALGITKRKVEIVERHTVDTMTVVKIDTIVRYKTKYIKEVVTDTIYVEKEGEKINLPRVQRHFREKSLYDAWISGYDPLIDSIKVYPKTEYTTITNNVTKEVTPLTWNLYFGGGLQYIYDDFAPYVSVTLKTPQKWLISAKIGLYKGKAMYGGEVSYLILGNNGKKNGRKFN